MGTQRSATFLGLKTVPGMVVVDCPSLPDVTCPLCTKTDLAFLTGKISFSVTIGGNDLFDGEPQPLVAVVCSNSHVFFLREKDVVPVGKLPVAA
jgi:hypothetical protein